jgi:hypothetical protein
MNLIIRDLGNGFIAKKYPSDIEWELYKNNSFILKKRTLKEIKTFLSTREDWRNHEIS